MSQTRRRFLTILAAASASGMALPAQARAIWTGRALGAEARLVLHGPADQTAAVMAEVQGVLRHVEAQFNLFDTASALSQLNRTGQLPDPHQDFSRLIDLSNRLHRATGGLFDPTVQPLWRALAEGRPPARAQALVGWSGVQQGPAAITLRPGQQLTLNGIAQGLATDLVADVLRRHGMAKGLVQVGELAARGGPWRIGIEDPALGPVLTRRLSDGAMATSSPDAMRLGTKGHILGPQGQPALWSTVTVEAETATLADGMSTALCFVPAPALRDMAKRLRCDLGLRQIIAIDHDGNIRTF
ncbi:FAD:protein FMN transferase [Fluviibacterium sp. DFM31]|uniref:FAD:protein FMN transferase n=1 Tax=Meridianimarinicoccus marinus TaxID=3231483 RepID=A0ABV3L8Z6_9RHOB